MTYKHIFKKHVFDKVQKRYRDIFIHSNAKLGSDFNDKHGQEIFEGDFVRYDGYDNPDPPLQVSFHSAQFWLGNVPLVSFNHNHLEIVED